MKTILIALLLTTSLAASAEQVIYVCKYSEKTLNVSFELETSNMTARVVGADGYTDSVQPVINAFHAITFIEITGTGNVMTTTIADSGVSIHSRNYVGPPKPDSGLNQYLIPSQYKGSCSSTTPGAYTKF